MKAGLDILAQPQDRTHGQLCPPAAPFPTSAGPGQRHSLDRRLAACILIWQHLPSDQQWREKT